MIFNRKNRIISLISFFLFSHQIYAEPTNICRWNSDYECRSKAIGSNCGTNGQCFARSWTFSEPDCKCYEKPEDSKNYCRWTSDSECKNHLPGKVRGGTCQIKSITFNEPECKFIAEGRDK